MSRTGPTVRIRVPNQMFAEWLRSQYLQEIRSALGEAGFAGVENVEFDASAINGRGVIEQPGVPERSDDETCPLNRRYTFDNFVVSSCNQFAHAAAHAVSEKPGRAYNPLFLYGGVGLGKTHLMQAIGAQILRERPTATVRYMTSEQFMNALISAIRYEDTPRFRDRYRSVDVLLIDDVQFLAGKESTQEEFFHTFNALYDSGRQIVLTSDCPPRSIPALEERLRSRFEWGLLADLQPPDLETKVAILNKMAGSQGLRLPPEVALFIASNVRSNVRELEGSLTTLIAASSIHRRPLDLDLAHEVIKTLVPADREPVTIEAILRVVARHFSLKVSDLKAKTNARRITNPRQIAMYLAKTLAGESLPAIGKLLGGKHHTTVLHAVRKIENLEREDPSTEKLIAKLREELDG
jgi:chromosomal replication initiator protein